MANRGHQALEQLHADHHPESLKAKVGTVINSKYFEIVVLLLIFADMGLVAMEMSIDHEFACINPERVHVGPRELTALAGEGQKGSTKSAHLFLPALAVEENRRWIQLALSSAPVAGPVARTAFLSPAPGQLALNHLDARAEGDGLAWSTAATLHLAAHGSASGPVAAATEVHEEGDGKGTEAEAHAHGEHALICDDRHGHHAHHIAHNCHLWSVLILLIFEVELLIKIWINPSGFFSNRYHTFDLFVVSASLFIDTIMIMIVTRLTSVLSVSSLEIIAMLMVLSRVWRLVRIVHGIIEVVHGQKEEMDELENEVSEGKVETQRLEEKLQSLESRRG